MIPPDPIEYPLAPPQTDLGSPFTIFELYRAFRHKNWPRPRSREPASGTSLIQLNVSSCPITTIVSSWAQPLTTGNLTKLSWSTKGIRRTAALLLVIVLSPSPTQSVRFTPVWSNNFFLIPLVTICNINNMVFEPVDLSPPLFFITEIFECHSTFF